MDAFAAANRWNARADSPDSTKVQIDRAASPVRRRPVRGRKLVPAKPPEDWEKMLDLVVPPPPAPVTGGVNIFSVLSDVDRTGAQEEAHRADWTICRLKVDMKTLQVKYGSIFIPAGQYISSRYFQIGGVTGSLRFWPNGHFSKASKNARMRLGDTTNSWCALGLVMPEGTKLKFRFRVGKDWSEVRECHWPGCAQVWAPPQQEPGDLTNLVVGVEVLGEASTPRFRRPQRSNRMGSKDGIQLNPRDHGVTLPSPRGPWRNQSPRCVVTS
ncbi:unnamed protein product [Effrenium voratum]|nr:unnamed protein product [Effrenium voratum]CAJ1439682.1 unnamed protein product [Effrenium voratum]